jgi:hypothetical protein
MNIVHQLPGRVRIRLPGLQAPAFSQKLTEQLSQDDRITDVWVTPGCSSLTLCYEPLEITVPEIMALVEASLDHAAASAAEAREPEPPLPSQPEERSASESGLTAAPLETRQAIPTQELGIQPELVSADLAEATSGTFRCTPDEEADGATAPGEPDLLDLALESAAHEVREEAPKPKRSRRASTKEGSKKGGESKRSRKSDPKP